MKKQTAIALALILILTISFPCYATVVEEATTEHPQTTEYPDEPQREPDLVANAAIVMDAATGQILYEKNAYEKKYPASTTKIMTALLAIEAEIPLDESYTMTENAVWGVDRDSTTAGLDVGEKVTLEDLLYSTMVHSANDCAYALAEYISGDVQTFADLMNEKAKEIGCENTHFVTPNGLHDDDHYTTAYDLALITKYALQYDLFREVTGSVSYTIPPTNLSEEETFFWNGNKMILSSYPQYYYEYCEGGKTGYTMASNNTLVTFSKKDGLELICVILDCDGAPYAYSDSRALYNYCYNNYTYFYPLSDFSFDAEDESILQSNTILQNYYTSLNHDMINLTVDNNYSILIKKSIDTTQIQSQITLFDKAKDNQLGEITFTYNEEQIGSTPITTTTPLLSDTMSSEDEKTNNSSMKAIKKVVLTILAVIGACIGVLAIYLLFAAIVRKVRRSNSRRNRYRYRRRRKKRDDDYYF